MNNTRLDELIKDRELIKKTTTLKDLKDYVLQYLEREITIETNRQEVLDIIVPQESIETFSNDLTNLTVYPREEDQVNVEENIVEEEKTTNKRGRKKKTYEEVKEE